MDITSKWMGLIGACMVLTGIVWAGRNFRGLEAKIRRDRSEIKRIHDESRVGNRVEDASERLRQAGLPFTTLDDLMYLNQDIQLAALEHVKPSVSTPYLLAVAGAALSVISGVLALLGL